MFFYVFWQIVYDIKRPFFVSLVVKRLIDILFCFLTSFAVCQNTSKTSFDLSKDVFFGFWRQTEKNLLTSNDGFRLLTSKIRVWWIFWRHLFPSYLLSKIIFWRLLLSKGELLPWKCSRNMFKGFKVRGSQIRTFKVRGC